MALWPKMKGIVVVPHIGFKSLAGEHRHDDFGGKLSSISSHVAREFEQDIILDRTKAGLSARELAGGRVAGQRGWNERKKKAALR